MEESRPSRASREENSCQFNVVLFNRNVSISCNNFFLNKIDHLLKNNNDTQEGFDDFISAIEKIQNGTPTTADEFQIFKFKNMITINMESNFAKHFSSGVGESLSFETPETFPVDVIFAFIKKLEKAAFGLYHELNNPPQNRNPYPNNFRDRNQSTPRPSPYGKTNYPPHPRNQGRYYS